MHVLGTCFAAEYCESFFLPLKFGRTEHVKNTLNPVFTKAIEICYRFEEKQDLKFAVYDIDNLTETLSDDELLGTIECSLAEVSSLPPSPPPFVPFCLLSSLHPFIPSSPPSSR